MNCASTWLEGIFPIHHHDSKNIDSTITPSSRKLKKIVEELSLKKIVDTISKKKWKNIFEKNCVKISKTPFAHHDLMISIQFKDLTLS
jgi:uncharacterized protein YjlB